MVTLDEFSKVSLEHQEQFHEFYKKYPPPHSDYSFATMCCWQNYMHYRFKFIDDSLLISTICNDKVQLRPPIGKVEPELDQLVFELARNTGTDPPVVMIDNIAKRRITNQYKDIKIIPDRDFFDYVYLSTALSELAGKDYIKLRNLTNRFRKRYEYQVEAVTSENISEVQHLLNRWCLWKDCDKIPLLSSEKEAVLYCIDHFFELGVGGLAVRINDDLEAVAIYEHITHDTVVVHFEKAIPDFEGLYQVINQESAKEFVKHYKFINRESDMGFSGLRLAKEKYHPVHMNEVFHISRDELTNILK